VHGHDVGFTWAAEILLAAAITTATLLRRPAATAAPTTGTVPATTATPQEAGSASPVRCLETRGSRA
jgi:hypothetical protein